MTVFGHVAAPATGSVRNTFGDSCPAAVIWDYPLTASCVECRRTITCADGTADWGHLDAYLLGGRS